MGIGHGARRCSLDCSGRQLCWRRVIGACIGSRCIGNPVSGIRWSSGYYVDALLRSNPTASSVATDLRATRRELARILTTGLRDGDVPAPDRTYMALVVAARTGLNQADAEKRVSDVINQAKTALDNARKSAAKLSLWLTASLLIGAFSASLAATEGGYVRDNWNQNPTGR